MRNPNVVALAIVIIALLVGQALAMLINPSGYFQFLASLRIVLSQIAFWGPIIALIAGAMIFGVLRLLGFNSLEEIRQESVEQNNPTPAIIFAGTLIGSMLFLALLIRP
ncbi:MAG: hypothetical protein ACT4QE_15940 [Anaerolineales bacterium]